KPEIARFRVFPPGGRTKLFGINFFPQQLPFTEEVRSLADLVSDVSEAGAYREEILKQCNNSN
ncbi:MAG: hypothetical protein ACPH77_15620, partial [Pseudomonadales bacterium]